MNIKVPSMILPSYINTKINLQGLSMIIPLNKYKNFKMNKRNISIKNFGLKMAIKIKKILIF